MISYDIHAANRRSLDRGQPHPGRPAGQRRRLSEQEILEMIFLLLLAGQLPT
jgi:cytochrome P450